MTVISDLKVLYYRELNSQIGQIEAPGVLKKSLVIPKDEQENHPGIYALGVTVTVLAAGAFVAANIISFPFAGPISLLALGILSAVTYGILNDQLACRQCIEYFTIGHTSIHKRLLKTDNPTLNGIVWGIHATWILGAIAGIVMAGAALATRLVVLKVLPFLIPIVVMGIVATCLYSHIKAKKEEEEWQKPENKVTLDRIFNERIILPKKGFHPVNLSNIPQHKRAAYMGVGKRNEMGYKIMPVLGGIALIGIIALGIIL